MNEREAMARRLGVLSSIIAVLSSEVGPPKDDGTLNKLYCSYSAVVDGADRIYLMLIESSKGLSHEIERSNAQITEELSCCGRQIMRLGVALDYLECIASLDETAASAIGLPDVAAAIEEKRRLEQDEEMTRSLYLALPSGVGDPGDLKAVMRRAVDIWDSGRDSGADGITHMSYCLLGSAGALPVPEHGSDGDVDALLAMAGEVAGRPGAVKLLPRIEKAINLLWDIKELGRNLQTTYFMLMSLRSEDDCGDGFGGPVLEQITASVGDVLGETDRGKKRRLIKRMNELLDDAVAACDCGDEYSDLWDIPDSVTTAYETGSQISFDLLYECALAEMSSFPRCLRELWLRKALSGTLTDKAFTEQRILCMNALTQHELNLSWAAMNKKGRGKR